MSNKLLLEKLKVFHLKHLKIEEAPRKELWRVTFISEYTGNALTYETDSIAQAELFRQRFGLRNDPTTAPVQLRN